MENNNFVQKIFEDINLIRRQPNALNKTFEKVKLTMSRFKAQEAVVKDLNQYLNQSESASSVSPVTLVSGLSELAQKQIEIYEQTKSFSAAIDNSLLLKRAEEYVEGFTRVHQLADQGAEDAENAIFRILFNKMDKDKKNRKVLFDDHLRQVGIACKRIKDELTVVIVFADKCHNKPTGEITGDVSELREAFESFNPNKDGRINPKETADALRALGYEEKSPAFYNLIKQLDTPENVENGIDFDTFARHVCCSIDNTETEDSLRRIFDLFIDDPSQDTITLATLKKIAKELDLETPLDDLKEQISRAAGNGTEFTFEEFCDFMRKKYPSNVKA